MPKYELFTPGASNPKTAKGEDTGYSVLVLHLAPHNLAGAWTVCPWATPECIASCLNTAGRGGIGAGSLDDIRAGQTNAIQAARVRRTREFFEDSDAFVARLASDIRRFVAWCTRNGRRPAVRLNGTSDIAWERVARELFAMFPQVTFYDYTKAPLAKRSPETMPDNYVLTMSHSGANWAGCLDALQAGRNVAVVFATKKGQALPRTMGGYRVIDGDEHDLRFLDPKGVIVGLRAKGRARGAVSPFIVRADDIRLAQRRALPVLEIAA